MVRSNSLLWCTEVLNDQGPFLQRLLFQKLVVFLQEQYEVANHIGLLCLRRQ